MGNYTGLRFAAPLNEAGLAIIGAFYAQQNKNAELAEQVGDDWHKAAGLEGFHHDVWIALTAQYNTRGWHLATRHNFIPNGVLCYMPADWEQTSALEDGVWKVCRSLKNGPDSIGFFLTHVLPYWVAGAASCEVLYEADTHPKIIVVHQKRDS